MRDSLLGELGAELAPGLRLLDAVRAGLLLPRLPCCRPQPPRHRLGPPLEGALVVVRRECMVDCCEPLDKVKAQASPSARSWCCRAGDGPGDSAGGGKVLVLAEDALHSFDEMLERR